jgi:predicted GTPase
VVAEAADQINAYFMGDSEIERIVFGGNLKLAHAVKHQLHPSVADMLVSIEPIDIKSTNDEVAAAVKRIAEEHEQEHDLALMNDLVSRRHACGTAVLETQGVQIALESGQAQKLVIAMPIESDKFDPLLIDAVINNVEIEFVHAAAADQLNSFGGVAAKLYYSGK